MFVVLLQVALTNLLLSSDNVLMIALMGRGVRAARRWLALLWSLLASVAAQLGILFVVAFLFRFPMLPAVFGLVICFMAFHLTRAERPRGEPGAGRGVGQTVARITAGNLMMSFENEAALIALARGDVWVAWIGMLATAPVVFFGSDVVVSLLRRHPLIVSAGAVYLFNVGARLVLSAPWWSRYAAAGSWALTALFAAYVALGILGRARARQGAGGG